MSAPGRTVEISFTTGPFAAPTWVDVSAYVKSVQISRGRSAIDQQPSAGTATLVLDNVDGRFDPDNTSGAYTPNVRPRKQIRISATVGGNTYRRFTGWTESWTRQWDGDAYSETTLTCTDLFKDLSLAEFPAAYGEQVLSDQPRGYWRLNDRRLANNSTNLGTVGTAAIAAYVGAKAGQYDGPLASSEMAAHFDGVNDYVEVQHPEWFKITGNMTVEAWVYADSVTGTQGVIGCGNYFDVQITGSAFVFTQTAGSTSNTVTSGAISAGTWYHVCAVRRWRYVEIWVNGVKAATTAIIGHPDGTPTHFYIGRSSAGYLGGRVAEVAVYPKALAQERILAHYRATADTYDEQFTGDRISGLIAAYGWAGSTAVDTGNLRVSGYTAQKGASLLQAITDTATSELGLFYVAADGTPTYESGHHRLQFNTTSLATIGDGASEINPSDAPTLVMDDGVVNDVQVSMSDDRSATSIDTTSQTNYGPRRYELATALSSTIEAQSLADWILGLGKDPQTRVDSVPVDVFTAPTADQDAILALDLSGRITVTRRPTVGATFSRDLHIESVSEAFSDTSYSVEFGVTPAQTVSYFVIGTSSIDGTDLIAF